MSTINKPVKPYTFTGGPGQTALASEVNSDFDVLYAKVSDVIDVVNTTDYQAITDSVAAAEDAKDAAIVAQATAEAALDSFDDRYLGAKASDPATDNDGNSIVTGALYFNGTSNIMRIYTGAVWQDNNAVSDASVTNAKLAFDGGALSGFRNVIINGESLVSTRGTGPIVCPAGSYTYTTDRNIVNPAGASVIAQQSTALLVPGHNSGLVINNAAGLTQIQFGQRIASQNSRHLAGGYVAVQFWLYQNSGSTATVGSVIHRANSADAFGTVTSDAWVTQDSTTLPTATWKQFKGYALLTAAATTGLYAAINVSGTLSSGVTIMTVFQIEQGATCTPYECRPRTVEQVLCYPYLPHVRAIGGSVVGMGQCYDTSTADILVPLIVPPRVPPTGLTIASPGYYTLSAPSGAANACNSVVFNGANYSAVKIRTTLSAPPYPLSAGNIAIMSEANTSATIYFTGCEL